jgi:hypothetical protein
VSERDDGSPQSAVGEADQTLIRLLKFLFAVHRRFTAKRQ